MILRVTTAVVFATAVNSSCFARPPSDRFTVELEVLSANSQAVLSSSYSARYKQGLKLRIASSLGSLHFLARQYLAARQQRNDHLLQEINALRIACQSRDWPELARMSRALAVQYPLNLAQLSPRYADAQAINAGRHIYRHMCMGCHEHPDKSRAVPAADLFALAESAPTRELIARLISGVHGRPAVALRNPFSDREISGLAAYLKQHPQRQH